MPSRLLIPTSSLLWGLQFALLTPALALILATLYDASTADIGWTLTVYNTGGFLAAIALPAWADRRGRYIEAMLLAAVATLLLAAALAAITALPLATIALVVLGSPAGVGVTMLFAHLRHAGASIASMMNTRAVLAAAWVAGPPLATAIIGVAGGRGVLWTIVGIAVLNIVTTVLLARAGRLSAAAPAAESAPDVPAGTSPGDGPAVQGAAIGAGADGSESSPSGVPAGTPPSAPTSSVSTSSAPAPSAPAPRLDRRAVRRIITAVTLLQTTNATAVAFLSIYTTETLGMAVMWAGIALGLAAGLEIPALVVFGRIGDRFSNLTLMSVGALAGVAYYAALTVVTGPVMLLVLQVLNAITVATVAGIGMTLFQEILPGAGFSTGLFMNTRRIGAVLSGPIIALGALPLLGQRAVFITCALLTLVGLLTLEGVRRSSGRKEPAR